MDADLKALEQKISQLISVYGKLRQENAQLRLDLTASKTDSDLLKAKMDEAGKRIEALMERLP